MSRTQSRALLALTLILLSTGLLVLNLAGFLQPAEGLLLRPIAGVQGWLALRYNAIRDFVTSPRDVISLRTRVAELEAENARLQQELVSLREQAAEAEILSALLDYARSQPENRTVAASVIGRDVNPYLRSIWIDLGSDQGIAKGMPIVTERGLVGRVAEVFATAARVQLITDPQVAVNVRLQDSRADGVLAAQLNGELRVDLIDQGAEVKVGELVLTSGLGGSYPPDIPVGQVLSVRKRDFELFQQAVIQPTVDFEALEIVLVVTNYLPLPLGGGPP